MLSFKIIICFELLRNKIMTNDYGKFEDNIKKLKTKINLSEILSRLH